jgi:hypothetical protein
VKKLVPFVVDAVLVIVFCAIGRRSHAEAVFPGLLRTLWPFGAGLVIGWAIALGLRAGRDLPSTLQRFDGRSLWPTGVVVWASTLAGGMVLRVIAGQGTALSFILVAGTVLALFLLGWRAVRKALG